jgi:hypothetical protein
LAKHYVAIGASVPEVVPDWKVNLVKYWSEWQDLNLRPASPERGSGPAEFASGRNPPRLVLCEQLGRRSTAGLILETDTCEPLHATIAHNRAGVLFLDRPRRREVPGEHATRFATISSENKSAVYEHFFLRVLKKSRFYRTK